MEEPIRVLVRVRPVVARETGQHIVVKQLSDCSVSLETSKAGLTCEYDRVFGPESTQEDVFSAVSTSVEAVLSGVNCTVFAFGSTGTGKTFTMLGKGLEDELLVQTTVGMWRSPSQSWGVIPRAVHRLFGELDSKNGEVHCSYLQIYNDQIFDLLQDRHLQKPLKLREAPGQGVGVMSRLGLSGAYVEGLSEFRVAAVEDVMRALERGGRNRTVRATEYNQVSSRSHAVLQLSVRVEHQPALSSVASGGGSPGRTSAAILRHAKFNLVDLAGSEKWNTSIDIAGRRQRELTNINTSLSALATVISALSERNRSHVPYRDSKLTRLLQDSLGGNTRTFLLCTLSPAESGAEDSASTLLFADQAKKVMVRVQANEVVDDAVLLARAQAEIVRLKRSLRSHQQAAATLTNGVDCDKNALGSAALSELDFYRETNKELKTENLALRKSLRKLKRKLSRKQESDRRKQTDYAETSGFAQICVDENAFGPGRPAPHEVAEALQEQLDGDDAAALTNTPVWDVRTERAMDAAVKECTEVMEKQKDKLESITEEREQLLALLQTAMGNSGQLDQETLLLLATSDLGDDSQATLVTSDRHSGVARADLTDDAVQPLAQLLGPNAPSDAAFQDEGTAICSDGDASSSFADSIRPTSANYNLLAAEKTASASSAPASPSFCDDQLLFSAEDIGCRLRLYVVRIEGWVQLTILDFDEDSGMHRVRYEDGSLHWHQMLQRRYVSLPRGIEGVATLRSHERRAAARRVERRAINRSRVERVLRHRGPRGADTGLHAYSVAPVRSGRSSSKSKVIGRRQRRSYASAAPKRSTVVSSVSDELQILRARGLLDTVLSDSNCGEAVNDKLPTPVGQEDDEGHFISEAPS